MKKALMVILACILSLAVLCGCGGTPNHNGDNHDGGENNSNDGGEGGSNGGENNSDGHFSDDEFKVGVWELLTEEELIDFHLNGAKYPDNFVFEELNGYGRVIESAISSYDALWIAAEHFNNGSCTTVEKRLTAETDLFYGVYVKWAYRSNGVGEPTSYYDEYVVSFNLSAYDARNMRFFTKDEDDIKSILNYLHYSRTYNFSGSKVYSSEIALEDGKYKYTAYLLEVTYGDWGMQDQLRLVRSDVWVDLATGEVEHEDKTVGRVYIDGALTHVKF